jgi:hypothetical protein
MADKLHFTLLPAWKSRENLDSEKRYFCWFLETTAASGLLRSARGVTDCGDGVQIDVCVRLLF